MSMTCHRYVHFLLDHHVSYFQGMARQFSQALTGIQIDAIYHTAIVFNSVEYFFGQGVHRKIPGSTHHGRPMSVVDLGKTELPIDVVEEYVDSLEQIYTPESYDLFLHNCNNFTQDLAMFLVGKSIPDEITSLPETFLSTPIGQMLRTQLDQSMRTMTQAPDAMSGRNAQKSRPPPPVPSKPVPNGTASNPTINPLSQKATVPNIINSQPPTSSPGHVYNITTPSELDSLLSTARDSCAVIFFTSATCPPCKIAYPTYDELASEAGDLSSARLIKIDISASHSAQSVAQRYQIRATPTFVTFLKGQKQDEWSGANPAQLRGNVRLLFQMARPPQHRHAGLKLPNFQRYIERPTLYSRTPPFDKLLTKIGDKFSSDSSVQALVSYIKARDAKGSQEAPLPNLHDFSAHLSSTFSSLPSDTHFAVIDLVRTAAVDSRVSSFLTTEPSHKTLDTLFPNFQTATNFTEVKYNVQSVTLQLACNLFSSTVFQEQLFRHGDQQPISKLQETIETLAAQALLSPHANSRSMAAALVYNLSAYTHNERIHRSSTASAASTDESSASDEASNTVSDDLTAALLESIISLPELSSQPTSPSSSNVKETLHALLLALGMLLYGAPAEDMLWDLCRAMEVRETLATMAKDPQWKAEPLLRELAEELLGKGGF
jgi:thiol-disulfide isomerase/thioredoxin